MVKVSMDTSTPATATWPLVNFLEFEKALNGDSKLPLHARRKGAFETFSKNGFPTPKIEEWKYTNVAAIRDASFALVQKPSEEEVRALDLTSAVIPDLDCYKIVLADGFFVSYLTEIADLPKGVTVLSLADAQKQNSKILEQHLTQYASPDESFTALNTSFIRDGVVIHIEKGVVLDKPLHIQTISTGKANSVSTPRILLVAEANSELTFIETYLSATDGAYLTNSVVECVCAENSHVDHYRIQSESENAFHVSTIQAQLEKAGGF